MACFLNLAGVPGLEPGLTVLETDALPIELYPCVLLLINNTTRRYQFQADFGIMHIEVFIYESYYG